MKSVAECTPWFVVPIILTLSFAAFILTIVLFFQIRHLQTIVDRQSTNPAQPLQLLTPTPSLQQ